MLLRGGRKGVNHVRQFRSVAMAFGERSVHWEVCQGDRAEQMVHLTRENM